jgi:hypothetical protein
MTTLMSMLVKIGADTGDLKKGLTDGEKLANGFAKTMSGIGSGIALAGVAAATAAVSALAGAMKIGLDEAMEWQDGIAQLDAGLKSTGSVAGVTKQSILDLADSMQAETRFSDDAILSASTLALTFTKISKGVFPEVIQLSADMATRMKMDLNSALMSVARAMQDPIAGAGMLRRQGVMLTDQQEAMIKVMVAAGDQMGAQKIILGELATEFGGAAKAAGATFGGQLAIIGNQARDFAQLLGDPLIPVLQEVAAEMLAAFKDPAIKAAISGLGMDIAAFARNSITNIKGLTTEVRGIAGALQENLPTIGNVGLALASVFVSAKIMGGIAAMTAAIAGAGGLTAALASAGVALGAFALAAAPVLALAGLVFAGVKAIEGAAATKSAVDRIRAIDPTNAAIQAQTGGATIGTGAGGMIDDLVTDLNNLSAPVVMSTDALEALATSLEEKAALDNYMASLVETSSGAWIMAEDAVREGGTGVGSSLTGVATGLDGLSTALAAWDKYIIAAGEKAPMSTAEMQRRKGATVSGIYGLGATPVERMGMESFVMRDAAAAARLGATPGALGGGLGAGLSMSMPDVLARAFGSMGEAQGWQGAFKSVQGREAGVTDVRDMMAGNAFAARTGRAATDEEWQSRYYSGGFEGEDKTGLDAIFGKSGTLTTKMEAQAASDKEDYKKMLDAFAAQKTATDTGNATLGDILEKITPASPPPPPPPPRDLNYNPD